MVVFLFTFLYQQARERFSNNSEVTSMVMSIFHCLIKNFNLIYVQTVSTNLYLADDSVCIYMDNLGKEMNWNELRVIHWCNFLL